MKENVIVIKSDAFAKRIVRLYKYLMDEKHEFRLSSQIVRSGTSIAANVREAVQAQSRNDFISKMSISLKEAYETQLWIDLLHTGEFITYEEHFSLRRDCDELYRILSSIVKSTRS